MPRFHRETSRERGLDTTLTPAFTSTSSPSSSVSPASLSTGDVESSMVEELQRRKAAFLAHFKSNSTSFNGADEVATPTASEFTASRSLDVAMTPQTGADSKCHVCNVSLRLLRVRVGFTCFRSLVWEHWSSDLFVVVIVSMDLVASMSELSTCSMWCAQQKPSATASLVNHEGSASV